MGGVLTGFTIIGFVILVGYIAGRLKLAGESAGYVLNRTAFFVATPALMFTVLSHADVSTLLTGFFAVALLSTCLAAGLYVLISAIFFRRPLAETTIGAAASGYVNANNIGLPVAVYVLGDPQYVAPVLLLQVLLLSPAILGVLDTTTRGRASLGGIVTQPIRNPMIIASILGIVVAVSGVQIPAPVTAPIEMIGQAAIPLVLLAFGMSLNGQRPLKAGSGRKMVAVAALLKIVVMPVIAFVLARFAFGMTGPELFAAVTIAALPTAQNIYNFAARYDRGTVLARDTVIVTMLGSIPMLIVIAWLFA